MMITDIQQPIRSKKMIKLKGAQAAAPASGSATSLGSATMVRCYNSGSTIR